MTMMFDVLDMVCSLRC